MGHENCILIAYFLPATELAIHLILTVEGLHVPKTFDKCKIIEVCICSIMHSLFLCLEAIF